jgi:hypothetical protein
VRSLRGHRISQMKQANNNEVDLLLRSLARARDESALERGSSSGDGNRATSDHLDADELNSYAEGVVPPPARARYTEHLADCDVCRGIVVGLTSAAGAAIRSEAMEQKGGAGFWQTLALLFSPAVLRYAVPALVLTAVIGISLLAVWQRREQHELLARNEPADSATPTAQLKQTESPTSLQPSEAPATMPKRAESPAAIDSVKEENYLRDNKSPVAPGAGTRTGEIASSAPAAKDAGQAGKSAGLSELRPSYAPEPKAAATSSGATTLNEADKATQVPKEQPAKLEDQERRRDMYKSTPSDERGPNRAAAPRSTAAPQTNTGLDSLSAARVGTFGQGKKDKAGEKANVETRNVSGRRFAREGNAWVDTAYDSSRTPIKIARGSEQFRALVADEPELRAIAEQLNGVIIVVWKNRAYRIQ